jgi:hypothetical protein
MASTPSRPLALVMVETASRKDAEKALSGSRERWAQCASQSYLFFACWSKLRSVAQVGVKGGCGDAQPLIEFDLMTRSGQRCLVGQTRVSPGSSSARAS